MAAGLAVTAVLIIPHQDSLKSDPTYEDNAGLIRQPLMLVSGPPPVLFDEGETWKWLDLPKEGIVLSFSPGGGALNDGLRALGGTLSEIGNCESNSSAVNWSFRADGHFIGNGSGYQSLDNYADQIALPDHTDSIVMKVTIVTDPKEQCTIGLEWSKPSIARNRPYTPVPTPTPSPS